MLLKILVLKMKKNHNQFNFILKQLIMKKSIILLMTFLTIIPFSFAKDNMEKVNEDSKRLFRNSRLIGIKAGTNFSNMYDTEGEDLIANGRIGLAAGVFATLPFNSFFGLQPEILYSQKGFHAKGKILGKPYDFIRTTSFIDVPIYLTFKPVELITVLFGPQVSFLISQKDKFTSGSTSIEEMTIIKNDNIRKNIISLTAGLDFNFNNVVIGGRLGLDMTNNNGNGVSSTPRYKNVWLQTTIGIRI